MVACFDNSGGSAKQIFNATPAHVAFKDPIRVIQIADNQIETREITCQFCRQLRILRRNWREARIRLSELLARRTGFPPAPRCACSQESRCARMDKRHVMP